MTRKEKGKLAFLNESIQTKEQQSYWNFMSIIILCEMKTINGKK